MPVMVEKPKLKLDIPVIFYWEDEQVSVMTAAFKWKGKNFGLSFNLDSNIKRNEMNKRQLLFRVGATLDLLLHHGNKILDSDGNLNKEKVDDVEARKFWLDKDWAKQVAFVNKILRTKDITKERAKKLKLL